ncbi:MAG: DMT family transporter [Chlamydiales bacterium]|nr:DMT family transporter [Chlamydiales bacterium]
MEYQQPKPDLITGSLYSITAFFFFALSGLFLKGTTLYSSSSFFATFMVYVAATLITTPYVAIRGIQFLKTDHLLYHFCRAGFGIVAMLLYAYAMKSIPVMNATLLFNTAPLFIPLFGIYLLDATVTIRNWITIFIGFIGITLVIHPSEKTLANPSDIFGLLSGAALAVAFIYIKKLNKTEPTFRIVYYFFLLSTLMMLPYALCILEMPSWEAIGLAVCSAISLIVMQLCLTMAYAYAPPSKIGIFQYTTVVFVGIIEWLLWGVQPTMLEIIGFLVIASCGTAIIRSSSEH